MKRRHWLWILVVAGPIPAGAVDLEEGPLSRPPAHLPVLPRPIPPELIDRPIVDGDRVRSEWGSPYAIEILVKSGDEYRPRRPSIRQGRVEVPIVRREVYAVRLLNESDTDAAVRLTIDGRDAFHFSRVGGYTHFVIPAQSSGTIRGWHRTNEISDEFEVMEYRMSQGGSADRSGWPAFDVGTIQVDFAPAWRRSVQPMPLESKALSPAIGRLPDATGRGDAIEAPYQEVEREIGPVCASIRLWYSQNPIWATRIGAR